MTPPSTTTNTLFYGDNLDILREYIAGESVDLVWRRDGHKRVRNAAMWRLAVLAFLIVSCGASKSALVQEGDVTPPLRTYPDPMPWRMYGALPRTQTVEYYEVVEGPNDSNEVGHITIVTYDNNDDLAAAYQVMVEDVRVYGPSQPITGLGEEGEGREGKLREGASFSDIAFRACRTVVHVAYPGALDEALNVAKRIDERIVACSTQ